MEASQDPERTETIVQTKMGLENRTVKIILIVVVVLLIIGGIIGLVLGLIFSQPYVELEVWPRSEESYYWDQPLIEFRANDPGSWNQWVRRINEFLKPYETSVPDTPPRAPCSIHHKHDPQIRSPNCDIAMRMWDPCTADNFYGYAAGQPCVFLRLSHIHYWVPEPYNVSRPLQLPFEMPNHVRMAMQQHPAHNFGDHVWVSCDGEYPSDQENIGPIQYIPAVMPPGFRTDRLNTYDRVPRSMRGYADREQGPLVGVFFANPRRGVLINVMCRVWTRDLYYYDKPYTRVGRARFEIRVE